jgi:hypothetical protein
MTTRNLKIYEVQMLSNFQMLLVLSKWEISNTQLHVMGGTQIV